MEHSSLGIFFPQANRHRKVDKHILKPNKYSSLVRSCKTRIPRKAAPFRKFDTRTCLVLNFQAAALRVPGLPRPKTSSLNQSQIKAVLQSCITQILKGRPRSVETKNFEACFKDSYVRPSIKPAAASVLQSMNQCTRPGGINSKSKLYIAYESCVLRRAG